MIDVAAWTYAVLCAGAQIERQSGGAFALAPAASPVPGGPLVLDAEARVARRADVRVDLGGIAKGFAVDRAVDALVAAGVAAGVVNAGGDLRVFGGVPQRVDIRDPRRPGAVLCTLALADRALASSGGAPAVLAALGAAGRVRARGGAAAAVAASVAAPSCLIADALTKVVMRRGGAAAALLRHHRADALYLSPTGALCVTRDWRSCVRLAA
jgi:thiamine biosynthesis lipoprotein